MQVKTLRYHENEYGEKFRKQVGDTYQIDDAAGKQLISSGAVEEVASAKRSSEGGGIKGA